MSYYYIKFKSELERERLFSFFRENGFVFYRGYTFLEKTSLEDIQKKWPIKSNYSVGIFKPDCGRFEIANASFNFDLELEYIELERNVSIGVLIEFIKEYRKYANIPLSNPITLDGKTIEIDN